MVMLLYAKSLFGASVVEVLFVGVLWWSLWFVVCMVVLCVVCVVVCDVV